MKIRVDIFINRLCDQDVGVHFTQSEGINTVIVGVDDSGRRIILYDLFPECIQFLGDSF